jgi:hypothetical protein
VLQGLKNLKGLKGFEGQGQDGNRGSTPTGTRRRRQVRTEVGWGGGGRCGRKWDGAAEAGADGSGMGRRRGDAAEGEWGGVGGVTGPVLVRGFYGETRLKREKLDEL